MKYLKPIYNFLNEEALPLNLAKEYVSYGEDRPSWLVDKLNELFDNQQRVYIPIDETTKGQIQIKVEQFLSSINYSIKDYKLGIAFQTDNPKREIRIGKLLQKEKQTELLKMFNEDTNRTLAKQQAEYSIVICQHPYDVAGMSCGREWSNSCLNILGGVNKHYVPDEIASGTITVYYIKSSDRNINNPIGRINVKLYSEDRNDSIDDLPFFPSNWVWIPDTRVYGNFPTNALNVLRRWLEEKQGTGFYHGEYYKLNGLYNYSGTAYKVELNSNFRVTELYSTEAEYENDYDYEEEDYWDFDRSYEEGKFDVFINIAKTIFEDNGITFDGSFGYNDFREVVIDGASYVDEGDGEPTALKVATETEDFDFKFKIDFATIKPFFQERDHNYGVLNFRRLSGERWDLKIENSEMSIIEESREFEDIFYYLFNDDAFSCKTLTLSNILLDKDFWKGERSFGWNNHTAISSSTIKDVDKHYDIILENCNTNTLKFLLFYLPRKLKMRIDITKSPKIEIDDEFIGFVYGKLDHPRTLQFLDNKEEDLSGDIVIVSDGKSINDLSEISKYYEYFNISKFGRFAISEVNSPTYSGIIPLDLSGRMVRFDFNYKKVSITSSRDSNSILNVKNGEIVGLNPFPKSFNPILLSLDFQDTNDDCGWLIDGRFNLELPESVKVFNISIPSSNSEEFKDKLNIDIANSNVEKMYIKNCSGLWFLKDVLELKKLYVSGGNLKSLQGMPKVTESLDISHNSLQNLDGINIGRDCVVDFGYNNFTEVSNFKSLRDIYQKDNTIDIYTNWFNKEIEGRMWNKNAGGVNIMKSDILAYITERGEGEHLLIGINHTKDENGNIIIDGDFEINRNNGLGMIYSDYPSLLKRLIVNGNYIIDGIQMEGDGTSNSNIYPKFIGGGCYVRNIRGRDIEFPNKQTFIDGDFVIFYPTVNDIIIGNGRGEHIKGSCRIVDGRISTLKFGLDGISEDLIIKGVKSTPPIEIIFDNSNIQVGGDIDFSYSDILTLPERLPYFDGSLILRSTHIKTLKHLRGRPINKNLDLCSLDFENLEGFPSSIGGDLHITSYNFFGFTEDQIREVCDIKGKIIVTNN